MEVIMVNILKISGIKW